MKNWKQFTESVDITWGDKKITTIKTKEDKVDNAKDFQDGIKKFDKKKAELQKIIKDYLDDKGVGTFQELEPADMEEIIKKIEKREAGLKEMSKELQGMQEILKEEKKKKCLAEEEEFYRKEEEEENQSEWDSLMSGL